MHWAAAVFFALPLAAAGLPGAGLGEAFYGEVRAGKTFKRRLSSGLSFQLRPTEGGGFRVWLGEGSRRKDDFCGVATPPFQGPNPLDIVGFELISEEVSRARKRPGRHRDFKCVADRESFVKAEWALRRLLRPPVGQPEVAAAEARRLYELYQETAWRGELKVADVRLSNPEGKLPAIEYLRFRVRLNPPAASE